MLTTLRQSLGVDDPLLPTHPFTLDVILRPNQAYTSRPRDRVVHIRWNGRRTHSQAVSWSFDPRNAGMS